MSTSIELPFGTALVGQVENAFGAILEQQLSGTGLSAPQWITLTVAIRSGETVELGQLTRTVAGARKIRDAEARAYVEELAGAGLLAAPAERSGQITVTDAGRQLHARVQSAVVEVTNRLWGDLPADELTSAARVLNTVLARANDELHAA
jgi:DNA-binding MarR family transcriptional regulator